MDMIMDTDMIMDMDITHISNTGKEIITSMYTEKTVTTGTMTMGSVQRNGRGRWKLRRGS